jgi:hypothetical protein
MKDFKELTVWSKAHELTVLVYGHAVFPKG